MPTDRHAAIDVFLADHGWGNACRAPLADDASFRRYERISVGQKTAVLMDAPPPQEDVRPFLRIATHLCALGYSAPLIYASDEDLGFLLLEDLGDDTFTRVLAAGGDETRLYESAIDVLIDLHQKPADDVIPPGLAPYDDQQLLTEVRLMTEWAYPALTGGETLADDALAAYEAVWCDLFADIRTHPRTLVLRDYHVDNLLWLPDRDGVGRCGLLDFQDALAGPAAYDLMSLLEDARRDVDPDMKAALLDRYYAAFAQMDKAAFGDVFDILAAQRHAKVIGIFIRLNVRDGKADYLAHIPRVWRLFENSLENPVLNSVKKWFDEHIPRELRAIRPSMNAR